MLYRVKLEKSKRKKKQKEIKIKERSEQDSKWVGSYERHSKLQSIG